MRLAALSDIHGRWAGLKFPAADVLVLAGDLLLNLRREKEYDAQAQLIYLVDVVVPLLRKLLEKKVYKDIIFVPGNHDRVFDSPMTKEESRDLIEAIDGVHFLINEGLEISGKKFWGSPYTSWFHGQWWAFQLAEPVNGFSQGAVNCWAQIPEDLDVLITHGPPFGILDTIHDGRQVGDPHLAQAVLKKRPRYHIFGHIHEAVGQKVFDGVEFHNVGLVDMLHNPVNDFRLLEI